MLADTHAYCRNQANLVENTIDSLRSLSGQGWGQHGKVAFFVVGAFLNEANQWKSFKSVSGFLHSECTYKI